MNSRILYAAPTIEPVTLEELKLHLRIDQDFLDEDEYLEQLIKTAREDVEDMTNRAIMTQTWDYFLNGFPGENFINLPFGNLHCLLSLTIADSACVEADGTKSLIFTGTNTIPMSGTYTIASNVITATNITGGGSGYLAAPTVATQAADGSITASMLSMIYKDSDGVSTTMVLGTDFLIETNGDGFGRVVLPYAESWPSATLYPSNPIRIRFACGWPTQALVPFKIKAAIKMLCSKIYESRGEDITGTIVHEDKTVDRLLINERLWGEF